MMASSCCARSRTSDRPVHECSPAYTRGESLEQWHELEIAAVRQRSHTLGSESGSPDIRLRNALSTVQGRPVVSAIPPFPCFLAVVGRFLATPETGRCVCSRAIYDGPMA